MTLRGAGPRENPLRRPGGASQARRVQIRPIHASDADFAAWYDVHISARLADHPTGPQWLEHELKVIYEGTEHHAARLWLAEDGGKAVGAAVLGLPLRDNLTLAEPEVFVRPEEARRGIGSALLAVLDEASKAAGRSSQLLYIEGPTGTGHTSGTAFAEKHGFTRRMTEIARVQRPPFDLDGIARAEEAARPHAAGYRIVTWRDRAPDEFVDEYARLEGRMSTDAPLGEVDYEPEVWDAARIRTSEQRRERMRRATWVAAAMAPDGSMAGITEITVSRDSDVTGFQDATIVDPRHRGHRLGLLLKAANLRQLLADRPGLQTVWTWNADSNAHMIAINETLGYQVAGWSAAYQRSL
ncbi:GNAT family N-acetyltransferase [Jiangella rhizosphaerae]|uniref:GNAT family N-acetyltransferase n=1 Tax=Jiangella rhizosphaerae TaxID=2293569 RepID=A0A418KJ45_9ACTN|nr:GNAT family N-acetyltransferase [Jiangella rhizosphaerae]